MVCSDLFPDPDPPRSAALFLSPPRTLYLSPCHAQPHLVPLSFKHHCSSPSISPLPPPTSFLFRSSTIASHSSPSPPLHPTVSFSPSSPYPNLLPHNLTCPSVECPIRGSRYTSQVWQASHLAGLLNEPPWKWKCKWNGDILNVAFVGSRDSLCGMDFAFLCASPAVIYSVLRCQASRNVVALPVLGFVTCAFFIPSIRVHKLRIENMIKIVSPLPVPVPDHVSTWRSPGRRGGRVRSYRLWAN